jgi:8-oxo-dGTP diphosphatase
VPDGEKIIEVVAVAMVVDRKVLLVRKAGTVRFMLPGGKREKGEDDLSCCVREIKEELNLELDPAKLVAMGTHCAEAANEPETTVVAAVFEYAGQLGTPKIAAEIDELQWYKLDAAEDQGYPLAPLLVAMLPKIRAFGS